MAPSTCSHTPSSRQMRPTSCSGSAAPAEVVPTAAQTKKGTRPAARSSAMRRDRSCGRMAYFSSSSTRRSISEPMPAMRAAFSIEEWAWLDA